MAPSEGEVPRHPSGTRQSGQVEVDQSNIGAPDNAAFPPPTSAGDWEEEKEIMQATLDVMMPGSAPTRSCTRCPGELTLNWREGKSHYMSLCPAGLPAGSTEAARAEGQDGLAMPQVSRPDLGIRVGRCHGNLSSSWRLQPGPDAPVDGAWEAIGGLSKQETGDELGLSYESSEMLGSIVDPERSYVWAFTGGQVPGSRNTMVRSPLSARVIFNVDDGDVITKNKHPIDYHLGDSEVTVYVVQEFECGGAGGRPARPYRSHVRQKHKESDQPKPAKDDGKPGRRVLLGHLPAGARRPYRGRVHGGRGRGAAEPEGTKPDGLGGASGKERASPEDWEASTVGA